MSEGYEFKDGELILSATTVGATLGLGFGPNGDFGAGDYLPLAAEAATVNAVRGLDKYNELKKLGINGDKLSGLGEPRKEWGAWLPLSFLKQEDAKLLYYKGGKKREVSREELKAMLKFAEKQQKQKEQKRSEGFKAVEDFFGEHLAGQIHAVKQVAAAVEAWDCRKPLVLFLFGPSGVGKSMFGETLARFFQHRAGLEVAEGRAGFAVLESANLLRVLPCNQISKVEDINIAIGTAPGYKGDNGLLYEAAALADEHPVVCILDEFNRATSELQDVLLDVLETGVVRSRRKHGEPRSARRMIFVLTSNLAETEAEKVDAEKKSRGDWKGILTDPENKDENNKAVLSPALFSRIDVVAPLLKLEREEMKKPAKRALERAQEDWASGDQWDPLASWKDDENDNAAEDETKKEEDFSVLFEFTDSAVDKAVEGAIGKSSEGKSSDSSSGKKVGDARALKNLAGCFDDNVWTNVLKAVAEEKKKKDRSKRKVVSFDGEKVELLDKPVNVDKDKKVDDNNNNNDKNAAAAASSSIEISSESLIDNNAEAAALIDKKLKDIRKKCKDREAMLKSDAEKRQLRYRPKLKVWVEEAVEGESVPLRTPHEIVLKTWNDVAKAVGLSNEEQLHDKWLRRNVEGGYLEPLPASLVAWCKLSEVVLCKRKEPSIQIPGNFFNNNQNSNDAQPSMNESGGTSSSQVNDNNASNSNNVEDDGNKSKENKKESAIQPNTNLIENVNENRETLIDGGLFCLVLAMLALVLAVVLALDD